MTFLSLTSSDVDLILSIQRDNFSDGWNKEMLISAFEEGRFSALLLEDNGRRVGLITYSVALDTADIEGVVVVSQERKKGYGKSLVNRAEQELLALNVKKIFLEVRQSNVPAIALYASCGFKNISVRKKYYPDGENAVVMLKEIL